MEHFRWDKLSLLAHSIGSLDAFLLSALFPTKVDFLILLDGATGDIQQNDSEIFIKRLGDMIGKRSLHDKDEPRKTYTLEQCTYIFYESTRKSLEKKYCKHILERKLKMDEFGKYYFGDDNRTNALKIRHRFTDTVTKMLAQKVTAPTLVVKFSCRAFAEFKTWFEEVYHHWEQNKQNVEFHEIDGKHFLHLSEPDKICDIINDFILKQRSVKKSRL